MSEVEPPPPGTEDLLPMDQVPSVTNTVASLEDAPEHEEGEIEDDDDEEEEVKRGLEYENISSDEEFIIRERLLQLQAMDTELGLLNKITGRSGEGQGAARRNASYNKRMQPPPAPLPPAIGKENYECISDDDDDDFDLFRYDPVPKPKPLPVRRKLRTSSRSGPESLKALRQQHRPSTGTSSSRYRISREHPGKRPSRVLEKRKHEPRKHSLPRKHKRKRVEVSTPTTTTTTVNVIDSSDSERDFPLDRARLQAACSIQDTKKRKTDKENWDALKRKLQLSMQQRKKSMDVASREVDAIVVDEPMLVEEDEDEEDEEVLQLRLQALKTKAELKETDVINLLEEQPVEEVVPPASEKGAEEQELRMIALQSAFTKKHQIRLKKRQEERPYSPSDEIRLLSPVTDLPGAAEVVDVDEDVQIIVTKPETVEIADSSDDDENRMEISPTESPIEPDVQPVDMELATSGESQSPAPPAEVTSKEPEQVVLQLDSPVSPVNEDGSGDLQSKFPEEDDEETLRNQLLSKLSGSLPTETVRPMTPDSMGEEEVDALRELILSRMNNKKVTKRNEPTSQALEISNENDSQNIPPVDETTSSISSEQPSSKVSTTNQPRGPTNPNLITLIGKQKIARKKKKKSAGKVARQAAAAAAAAAAVGPIAIAAPPPSRSLVKVPIPLVPPPPGIPPLIQAPAVTTTKVLVNPNKLINRNTVNNAPKEQTQPRSAMVENFVQKPVPKLVIQLGQSDSDSDPDYYSAPQSEPEVEVMHETFLRDLDNASPSRVTLESPTYSPIPTAEPTDEQPAVQKPTDPAFAQRLDQFLRTVRSQTDQNHNVTELPSTGSGSNGLGTARSMAAPSTRPKPPLTAPAAPITPSAVRHLPKSAQLEYKRLLARMAQLEKQRQQRFVVQNTPATALIPPPPTITKTIVNNGPEEVDKNHEIVVTVNRDGRDVTMPPTSPATPKQDTLIKRVLINNTVTAGSGKVVPQATVRAPAEETKDVTSKTAAAPIVEVRQKSPTKAVGRKDALPDDPDLATLREALRRLPRIKEDDRHRVLKLAEARYENHSKRFREELQELIGTVENAQYQRQKQYDLENKVAFLREKLTVMERALAVHKHRIVSIFPTLQESHTRVMASRKKSIELNNLCQAIGREVQGKIYSPPSGLRGEIHQRLKVLTNETKQLKNMKKLTLEEFKRQMIEQRRRQHEALVNERRPEPAVEPEPAESEESPAKTNEPEPAPVVQSMELAEQEECPAGEGTTKEPEPATVVEALEVRAKSAPTSRNTSPLVVLELERRLTATQEAPAVLSSEPTRTRFEQYTSPLASLQSAPNIPDGVICPYQMRGECVDKDCKFEHL
uniref:C3H1-type domain-containing protein n=1 Tax=Culex tarsalis TaxID=7177 RepID=A0A1Q3FDM2_CULTA